MKRVVNGINLENFLELEGQVIEPVPEAQRDSYVYWRAAHLGAAALNFIKGNMSLNSAWGVDYSHFRLEYDYALNRAKSMRNLHTQFSDPHRKELAELADIPEDFDHPSMVIALDERFNDGRQIKSLPDYYSSDMATLLSIPLSAPYSPSGGHILYGRLTLDKIDPHSRQAIHEIFDLPTQK